MIFRPALLLQMLGFAVIFLFLFSLMRLIMAFHFLGYELLQAHNKDSFELFTLGLVSDLRLVSAAFLPLLLCFFLSFLSPLVQKFTHGGGIVKK